MNDNEQVSGMVSVIIPVYNTEKYLQECLDSVLDQDYKNIEIIAVNDGSTDSSPSILSEYSKTNSNVHVVEQENQGLSCARNTGIEKSRGEFVYFLDSDDLLAPQAISKSLSVMHKHKADMLFFETEIFYDGTSCSKHDLDYWQRSDSLKNLPMSGKDFFSACIKTDGFINVMVSTYITKAETVGNTRFVPKIIHEDNVFTPKLLIGANMVIAIDEKLFRHRVRPNSIMTTVIGKANLDGYLIGSEELVREFDQLYTHETKAALSAHVQRLLLNAISNGYFAYGKKFPKHYLKRLRGVLNRIPLRQRSWKLHLIILLPFIAFTYLERRRNSFIKHDEAAQ